MHPKKRESKAELVMLAEQAPTVDVDGTARPWGHGAVGYRLAPAGWRCRCGAEAKGFLLYADGDEVCSACARAWCELNWSSPASEPPLSQQVLLSETR